jgi:hypothetical protein
MTETRPKSGQVLVYPPEPDLGPDISGGNTGSPPSDPMQPVA